MSLRPKYIVPCDIYQIDDSLMREQSVKESEAIVKYRCRDCKYWIWKVGSLGVCNLTNQTVSASEFCGFFKGK
jgi:hypothetical protein